MRLSFTKMQGCGNDYLYFDCFEQALPDPAALARRLSDRHFGVGGDGIITIGPSDVADAQMRIFNADGSEGRMCGNGIRCVGKYLYDAGRVRQSRLSVETLSGVKTLDLHLEDGKVCAVTVDMGPYGLAPGCIPVNLPGDSVVGRAVDVAGGSYILTCVSMGNPHCVVFVPDVTTVPLEDVGPRFEHSPLFPERVNTEFVQVLGPQELRMRVWERGSGETWACGTGACAAAVAAVLNGHCQDNQPIVVHLVGGDLTIVVTPDTVRMTGEAVRVFDGTVEA
jgi:diaminopimelate epimerase